MNKLEAYSIHNNSGTVEKVYIGANVNDIAQLALYNGYKLKEVNINSANKTYSTDNNFVYKLDSSGSRKEIVACIINKSEISIPEGIEKLGYYSFYSNSMKTIILPTTLKTISSTAFYNCRSLNNVKIPNSVTTIGSDSFEGCASLTSVKINKPKGSISGAPWGIPIGERAITWAEN